MGLLGKHTGNAAKLGSSIVVLGYRSYGASKPVAIWNR